MPKAEKSGPPDSTEAASLPPSTSLLQSPPDQGTLLYPHTDQARRAQGRSKKLGGHRAVQAHQRAGGRGAFRRGGVRRSRRAANFKKPARFGGRLGRPQKRVVFVEALYQENPLLRGETLKCWSRIVDVRVEPEDASGRLQPLSDGLKIGSVPGRNRLCADTVRRKEHVQLVV